jgi:Arc/MetJ-type ribon-helix-helix transcriptional regulator
MATTQAQVRILEELVEDIDRWITEGRSSTRSDAMKTIIALFIET